MKRISTIAVAFVAAIVIAAGSGVGLTARKAEAASVGFSAYCYSTSMPSSLVYSGQLYATYRCTNNGTEPIRSSSAHYGYMQIISSAGSVKTTVKAYSPTSYTVYPGQSVTFKYSTGTRNLSKGATYKVKMYINYVPTSSTTSYVKII